MILKQYNMSFLKEFLLLIILILSHQDLKKNKDLKNNL